MINKDKLKEHLYKRFIEESRDQLVSVYKQRVTVTDNCNQWGGCWTGLPSGISYQDIEEMVYEVY